MFSLGLGLPQQPQWSNFVRTYADDIADAYAARVIADGGTVEGLACLAYKIFLLGIRNIRDNVDITTTAYSNRVIADGGTVTATIDDRDERYRLWDEFFAAEAAIIKAGVS